jgi:hypothetical protein
MGGLRSKLFLWNKISAGDMLAPTWLASILRNSMLQNSFMTARWTGSAKAALCTVQEPRQLLFFPRTPC